jgi:hypothetical protein
MKLKALSESQRKEGNQVRESEEGRKSGEGVR